MDRNYDPAMTPIFAMDGFSFFYPEQGSPTLNQLNFTVEAGEFLLLCGPSGCGKSTLLRQFKTVLSPHGHKIGEVFFDGKPLNEWNLREQSQRIGFVQQSPDNQIVTDKVWHELAFGLESLGWDTTTIRRRVAEMASFFGIQTWFHRNVTELSGGQKQLLNLASIMVMQPSVLILDEPTSQLDPIAASEFLAILGKIHRELGTTILLTEHRLEEAMPLASRVAVMDRGQFIAVGSPNQVGELLRERAHGMFLAMPTPMRIWTAVESDLDCPITVSDGLQWLSQYAQENPLKSIPEEKKNTSADKVAVSAKNLWFRYDMAEADVIKGLDLQVGQGEILAILGGNGTGKTTALKLLAGLEKAYRGEISIVGRVATLPQNPQALFLKKSVIEDLRELFLNQNLDKNSVQEKIDKVVALCHLESLLERHPYDLSGGEQQRLALAKILLLEPEVLLLDEPTKGLDAEFKQKFAGILRNLSRNGVTILMVSHDIEFCAQYANRCALFFDGAIVTQDSPRAFFSGNTFYTTAANRMGRGICQEAVTVQDLIVACGGEVPLTGDIDTEEMPIYKKISSSDQIEHMDSLVQIAKEERKLSKRTILSAILILMLIPLTLFVGIYYLDGRKYYFIALMILLECMVPFFLVFEGRKPQARELVVVAVLSGIAVAGRWMFFMLPQFKPVMAICIIAGVALGGETGFLVGAMSMLVSNLFFAQGPWTPWQMFAMGIIGFLAGILFQKGLLRRTKISLAIFGFMVSVLVYGGIMNPAGAIIWSSELNWSILMTYYLSGLPMDIIQGIATAIFLWFGGMPMLEKLDRIKVKYGLI